MALSECGNYTAIGTISGSVGIYDTHEMKILYFAREAHSIFVTGWFLKYFPSITIKFIFFAKNAYHFWLGLLCYRPDKFFQGTI